MILTIEPRILDSWACVTENGPMVYDSRKGTLEVEEAWHVGRACAEERQACAQVTLGEKGTHSAWHWLQRGEQ